MFWKAPHTVRTDRDGDPNVFNLNRNGDGSWLNANNGRPDYQWDPDTAFVFVPRNPLHFSSGAMPGEFCSLRNAY